MSPRRRAPMPRWLSWDLELSAHVERRMEDRRFSEVDLREMLGACRAVRTSPVEGRFMLTCRHGRGSWEVVVEPDYEARRLIIVTAWAKEGP